MRIAILGAGNVGGTLGRRWAELGHEVAFGVRRPVEGAAAVKGGGALPPGARAAAPADAVRGAEVVLLATPWGAVPDALGEAGLTGAGAPNDAPNGAPDGTPDGVVLLDATNPIAPAEGPARLRVDAGPDGASGGERVQAMAPNARVVKAFNTTGWENMRDPAYGGARAALFLAGDDAAAKSTARTLAEALGFEAVDAGPLARARELEHLAVLWVALAVGAGAPALGRDFAFGLVRR